MAKGKLIFKNLTAFLFTTGVRMLYNKAVKQIKCKKGDVKHGKENFG